MNIVEILRKLDYADVHFRKSKYRTITGKSV